MTKPASTFIRMCPAVIATNSRSARLNGRIRKLISSIGNSTTAIGPLTPCGTNRLKKWKPCLAKPMTSTIAKLSDRQHAGDVSWLVTVNGCTPTSATGSMPSMLATG